MRKSREAAAETRKRIVRAAAREFREQGIVATGLADLMKAAGLTHGGFYKHFASKDQLVAAATMIGAVTMSRVVTDPGLSAEILSAAEKSVAADQVERTTNRRPGHFPLSLISGRRALGMKGKAKSESQNLTNKKRGKRYEKN